MCTYEFGNRAKPSHRYIKHHTQALYHRMPCTLERAQLCNMSLFLDRHRRKNLHTLLLHGEHEDFHSISWIVYQLLTATAAFVANAMNVKCLFTWYRYIHVRSVRMRFTLSQKVCMNCMSQAFRYYVSRIHHTVHRCTYVVQAKSFCIIHCLLIFSRCCFRYFVAAAIVVVAFFFPLCFVSDVINALCCVVLWYEQHCYVCSVDRCLNTFYEHP